MKSVLTRQTFIFAWAIAWVSITVPAWSQEELPPPREQMELRNGFRREVQNDAQGDLQNSFQSNSQVVVPPASPETQSDSPDALQSVLCGCLPERNRCLPATRCLGQPYRTCLSRCKDLVHQHGHHGKLIHPKGDMYQRYPPTSVQMYYYARPYNAGQSKRRRLGEGSADEVFQAAEEEIAERIRAAKIQRRLEYADWSRRSGGLVQ